VVIIKDITKEKIIGTAWKVFYLGKKKMFSKIPGSYQKFSINAYF